MQGYRNCPRCGAANPTNTPQCLRAGCGFSFATAPAPAYAPQAYPAAVYAAVPYSQELTASVLRRFSSMALGIRIFWAIGGAVNGGFWGFVGVAAVASLVTHNENPGGAIGFGMLGGTLGLLLGTWLGLIAAGFIVVWIEWASQMLAGQDNLLHKP